MNQFLKSLKIGLQSFRVAELVCDPLFLLYSSFGNKNVFKVNNESWHIPTAVSSKELKIRNPVQNVLH